MYRLDAAKINFTSIAPHLGVKPDVHSMANCTPSIPIHLEFAVCLFSNNAQVIQQTEAFRIADIYHHSVVKRRVLFFVNIQFGPQLGRKVVSVRSTAWNTSFSLGL